MRKVLSQKEILRQMMSQSANESEIEMLASLGFSLKKPTKHAVLLAVLYKKAAGGDISAVKALLGICDDGEDPFKEGVKIIDDIKNI